MVTDNKEILKEADEKNSLEDMDTSKDKYMLGLSYTWTTITQIPMHLIAMSTSEFWKSSMHQLNTFQPSLLESTLSTLLGSLFLVKSK